uniref:Uncharacterized protein n=1 Tax=Anguilla anguilla TaxID=7936 RepID=A0A0E9VNQ2_ANGAN
MFTTVICNNTIRSFLFCAYINEKITHFTEVCFD